VQLYCGLADLLAREEHRFLVKGKIKLLHVVLQIFILLLLLDVLEMPYSCFGQLLVVEAELFLPFGILSCRCSCVLGDLVLLIFSILIALRPVDLSILKSDFTIDIH
jgi:hypothetical protein